MFTRSPIYCRSWCFLLEVCSEYVRHKALIKVKITIVIIKIVLL